MLREAIADSSSLSLSTGAGEKVRMAYGNGCVWLAHIGVPDEAELAHSVARARPPFRLVSALLDVVHELFHQCDQSLPTLHARGTRQDQHGKVEV